MIVFKISQAVIFAVVDAYAKFEKIKSSQNMSLIRYYFKSNTDDVQLLNIQHYDKNFVILTLIFTGFDAVNMLNTYFTQSPSVTVQTTNSTVIYHVHITRSTKG